MLAVKENYEIEQRELVNQLESHWLDFPQVECPVVHHFGPGTYIRELTLKAGTLAIGHAQRFEHLNIMLTGVVSMFDDFGQVKTLRAPLIFVGQPGRKIGYIHETCVWHNVYATEERDIDKLEEMFFDKSDNWKIHSEKIQLLENIANEENRQDFFKLIAEAGFTPEEVRRQSENIEDQIELHPAMAPKMTIRNSPIEGKGLFVSSPVETGEIIAPARISGMRTPAGRYTNHSKYPNARFIKHDNGDIYLIALQRINGCCGGDSGQEVTVDYRESVKLARGEGV